MNRWFVPWVRALCMLIKMVKCIVQNLNFTLINVVVLFIVSHNDGIWCRIFVWMFVQFMQRMGVRYNRDDSSNQNDRLIMSQSKKQFKHSFVCCGFSLIPYSRSQHALKFVHLQHHVCIFHQLTLSTNVEMLSNFAKSLNWCWEYENI